MKTPSECMDILKKNIKTEWKIAFVAAFVWGLIVHLPAWIHDIPNHDGLASVYFDQNMITSGRWFLTVACGLTSYYTLPWLIGLLSLLWLSVTAVLLVDILKIDRTEWIVVVSGLLVSFPALASTYAYIFTADGYMMALMLAVLAVWLTKNYKKGFIFGGICLALSMGTYQAYLPVCILLCVYVLIQDFLEEKSVKDKRTSVIKCLGMGLTGVALYYIILQILLKLQGKELDTYQGINNMSSIGGNSIIDTLLKMYEDFVIFFVKGNILFNNVFSFVAILLMGIWFLLAVIFVARRQKLYKKASFWIISLLILITTPLVTNVILFVSPNVEYHLLMRYQYVFLLILMVAFISNYGCLNCDKEKTGTIIQWGLLLAGGVLCINFAVSTNMGYSNWQKRYEKTYAYCLRLADRIEQTEGYYVGMPIVMMGTVGDKNFPSTDVTGEVTANMIGLSEDFLCYKGINYQDFFKHYLGITIEIVDQEIVGEIYNTSPIYHTLDSFPGPNCTRVVDGVLYVKTENKLDPQKWSSMIFLRR